MPVMNKSRILVYLCLAILCITQSSCSPTPPPPSFMIIVPKPPSDVKMSLAPENITPYLSKDTVFESYFCFASNHFQSQNNILLVTTGGKTFEIAIKSLLKPNDNIFTLDLENQTLSSRDTTSRSAGLIFLMIFLMLTLGAILFYLFGFRKRKSWIIFLISSLITQGSLFIFLNEAFDPIYNYIGIQLFSGEFFLFAIEATAFSYLLSEHTLTRRTLFVATANFLILIAGGYLGYNLPL
jgi:hypothetical protein